MDFHNIKTVLVLAPHPDDGEFSSGGTLKRFSDLGIEIHYAAFSPCIKSLPAGMPEDTLWHELADAAKILGIAKEHIYNYMFHVRDLNIPAFWVMNCRGIICTLLIIATSASSAIISKPKWKPCNAINRRISAIIWTKNISLVWLKRAVFRLIRAMLRLSN